MSNDKAIKTAFIISFIGHGIFLSLPGNLNFPPPDKQPEPAVRLEIEKPALLPKITTLGKEKKFKDMPAQKSEFNPAPQKTKDEFLKQTPSQKIEVTNPAQEAMLRYQDMVKQKIEETRRYPARAKRQGIEGIAYLSFVVSPNGAGKDVKIIRSAGSALLDAEALATIKRAMPFPPLPREINTPTAQMEIAIVFSLK